MNNSVARIYFSSTITWSFSYNYTRQKIVGMKKCISLACHFDDHVDQSVKCREHRPVAVGQVLGYPRCHRMLPLGKYSPCIALVDTMVIDFGVKK